MTVESALRRDLQSIVDGLGVIVSYLGPQSTNFAVVPLHTANSGGEIPHQYSADVFDRVFAHHLSDKSTIHSYQEAYPHILAMAGSVKRVLEIGIGARSPSPDSLLGWAGQAGGSLHAWSQITGGAEVLGLDIDPRLEMTAPNISTRAMDSLDVDSVRLTAHAVSKECEPFDLIVDDGLHVPMANITNLLYFFALARPGGFYVVEDLHRTSATAICHLARLMGAKEVLEYSKRTGGYGEDNALVAIRKP